jgi:hypothetical protein
MKRPFIIAFRWTIARLLVIFVFIITTLLSCGGAFYVASTILYPEQTYFPNGAPTSDFLVVVESPRTNKSDRAFSVIRWGDIATTVSTKPHNFRLSIRKFESQTGEPWNFEVVEQTSSSQVIELQHQDLQRRNTTYSVEGGRITPLSYKTDGGVALSMLLMPVFFGCLLLGWWTARLFSRAINKAWNLS